MTEEMILEKLKKKLFWKYNHIFKRVENENISLILDEKKKH
jgi:hypothetical protein